MRKRVRSHSFRQPILNPKVYQTARRKHPEKKKDPSHPVEKTKGLAQNATGLQTLRSRISKI